MFKYIVKRILLSIFILFGVSVIIYFLIRLMPSDYVDKNFESQLNQGTVKIEDIQRMKELYGIGDNSFMGIVGGYIKWVWNMLHGDLGTSFIYKKPVAEVISDNMWISFDVAFIAFILQYLIAIPLGVKAATKQYSFFDYAVSVLVIIGISFPSFFFADILLKIFALDLKILPYQGLIDADLGTNVGWLVITLNKLKHLILPMIVLVVLSLGGLMRYTRTNTLEVLNSDYIRTARAKGLPEKTVINKHAFRNTLIPLVTMMAGVLPSLFGGAMIMETVFAIPGIGQMSFKAVEGGDIPFIMGYNMFLAVLTVIGTLLSDLAYSLVDPRVKLGR